MILNIIIKVIFIKFIFKTNFIILYDKILLYEFLFKFLI